MHFAQDIKLDLWVPPLGGMLAIVIFESPKLHLVPFKEQLVIYDPQLLIIRLNLFLLVGSDETYLCVSCHDVHFADSGILSTIYLIHHIFVCHVTRCKCIVGNIDVSTTIRPCDTFNLQGQTKYCCCCLLTFLTLKLFKLIFSLC